MTDITQRIEQVRNDREHGSRWLVRETLLILRDLAYATNGSSNEQDVYEAGRTLSQARPSMAALASAVGHVLTAQGGPAAMAREAERLLHEYDTATTRIAAYAKPLLHGTIMTDSISGTVIDVLAANSLAIEHVITLEGRPRYEGREMARTLQQKGLTVTLITDAQADIFMPQCESVVVGADSILANGDVLNKAGTALLGWSAQGHAVPFYVLCETLKISSQHWQDGAEQWQTNLALLEEKEGTEVLEHPIEGVTVRNFYFDRTPYALVTKVITEQGIIGQQEIAALAAQVEHNKQEYEQLWPLHLD
jgi:translation initiation factor 2B subunit (eIF-2B alpha/beta/delta family)